MTRTALALAVILAGCGHTQPQLQTVEPTERLLDFVGRISGEERPGQVYCWVHVFSVEDGQAEQLSPGRWSIAGDLVSMPSILLLDQGNATVQIQEPELRVDVAARIIDADHVEVRAQAALEGRETEERQAVVRRGEAMEAWHRDPDGPDLLVLVYPFALIENGARSLSRGDVL